MMPVALWILYPYLLESVIRIIHGLGCKVLWATSKPRLGPKHNMDGGVLVACFNVPLEVATEQLKPFRTPGIKIVLLVHPGSMISSSELQAAGVSGLLPWNAGEGDYRVCLDTLERGQAYIHPNFLQS